MDPADDAPTRPYQPVAALAGIVGFAVLALFMRHSTRPTGWERPLMSSFERHPLPLRGLWVAMFEPVTFAVIAGGLTCLALVRGRTRLAVVGIASCLGAVVSAELLFKPFVDRGRLHVVHHHLVRFGRPLFPSAHATAAAACATFAWLIFDRRVRLIPFLVAAVLIVGHSVISKKMHYPADVVGGLILGWTWVYATVGVTRVAINRPVRSEPPPHAESTSPV